MVALRLRSAVQERHGSVSHPHASRPSRSSHSSSASASSSSSSGPFRIRHIVAQPGAASRHFGDGSEEHRRVLGSGVEAAHGDRQPVRRDREVVFPREEEHAGRDGHVVRQPSRKRQGVCEQPGVHAQHSRHPLGGRPRVRNRVRPAAGLQLLVVHAAHRPHRIVQPVHASGRRGGRHGRTNRGVRTVRPHAHSDGVPPAGSARSVGLALARPLWHPRRRDRHLQAARGRDDRVPERGTVRRLCRGTVRVPSLL